MSINRRALAALVLVLLPLPAVGQPATSPVTVFAAASLTDSLKAVAGAYKAKTGINVTLSFGASSTLARQIEQGAKADIFLSADSEWTRRVGPEHATIPARQHLLPNTKRGFVHLLAHSSSATNALPAGFQGELFDRHRGSAQPQISDSGVRENM